MTKKNKETIEPLRGDALIVAVINQIIDHPETWKQSTWHCGTSHCFFGHAQILGGRPVTESAFEDGKELMELSYADASWLSQASRTLPQLFGFVKSYITRDRDGYNRDGYDRAGYNRDGYDRDGYDRAGYNRDGYNRDGYDRDGYNRDGEKLKIERLELPEAK